MPCVHEEGASVPAHPRISTSSGRFRRSRRPTSRCRRRCGGDERPYIWQVPTMGYLLVDSTGGIAVTRQCTLGDASPLSTDAAASGEARAEIQKRLVHASK